jgi:flagellar hook-length control protein FliK
MPATKLINDLLPLNPNRPAPKGKGFDVARPGQDFRKVLDISRDAAPRARPAAPVKEDVARAPEPRRPEPRRPEPQRPAEARREAPVDQRSSPRQAEDRGSVARGRAEATESAANSEQPAAKDKPVADNATEAETAAKPEQATKVEDATKPALEPAALQAAPAGVLQPVGLAAQALSLLPDTGSASAPAPTDAAAAAAQPVVQEASALAANLASVTQAAPVAAQVVAASGEATTGAETPVAVASPVAAASVAAPAVATSAVLAMAVVAEQSAAKAGGKDVLDAIKTKLPEAVTADATAPEVALPADLAAKATARGEAQQATQTATSGAVKELATTIEQAKPQGAAPQGIVAPQAAVATADVSPTAAPKAQDPAQAMARADAPVPLQAVAVEIGMRAMRGAKEFAIRLDPEDLGRVDIKLEISEKGEVQAKLVVERVETLQLLQRDARTLERAFDQAGLKTNPDGLQFTLRDPGQQGRGGEQDRPNGQRSGNGRDNELSKIDEIALRPAIYHTAAASGLDIRI